MFVKLLNNGGYCAGENVKFPVIVRAGAVIDGLAYVTSNELRQVGFAAGGRDYPFVTKDEQLLVSQWGIEAEILPDYAIVVKACKVCDSICVPVTAGRYYQVADLDGKTVILDDAGNYMLLTRQGESYMAYDTVLDGQNNERSIELATFNLAGE